MFKWIRIGGSVDSLHSRLGGTAAAFGATEAKLVFADFPESSALAFAEMVIRATALDRFDSPTVKRVTDVDGFGFHHSIVTYHDSIVNTNIVRV